MKWSFKYSTSCFVRFVRTSSVRYDARWILDTLESVTRFLFLLPVSDNFQVVDTKSKRLGSSKEKGSVNSFKAGNLIMRIPFYSLGRIAVLHTFISTLQRSSVTAFQTMSMSAAASSKRILYDMPVSNNGARCRLILYKKNIPKSEVDILPPTMLGEKGLKSPEYLAKNPQGKMPLLSILDESASGGGNVMNIPESDTICRYLLSEFESLSPSFLPNNIKSNLISRIHDMYLTTIQVSYVERNSHGFSTYNDEPYICTCVIILNNMTNISGVYV